MSIYNSNLEINQGKKKGIKFNLSLSNHSEISLYKMDLNEEIQGRVILLRRNLVNLSDFENKISLTKKFKV